MESKYPDWLKNIKFLVMPWVFWVFQGAKFLEKKKKNFLPPKVYDTLDMSKLPRNLLSFYAVSVGRNHTSELAMLKVNIFRTVFCFY